MDTSPKNLYPASAVPAAVQEGKDKGDAAAAAGMSCGELAALCTAGVTTTIG